MCNKKSISDSGGDGPAIVLLHGYLASLKYWNRFRPYLIKSGYRVIAIDLLGFGHSPMPKKSHYTYDDHIAYINDVISKLDISEKFAIIGHSMGANLATRYAMTYPEKISWLALFCPPLYSASHEARKTLRDTSLLYRFLLGSKYRQIGWVLLKLATFNYFGSCTKESRERSIENIVESSEVIDDLKIINTKTLLVIGLKDRPEYLNNAKNSVFSDSVKLVYASSSHHFPLLHPKAASDEINSFVN